MKKSVLGAAAVMAMVAGMGPVNAGSGGMMSNAGAAMAGQVDAAMGAGHDASQQAGAMHEQADAMHENMHDQAGALHGAMKDDAHEGMQRGANHGWHEVARVEAGLPAYTGKFRDRVYLMDAQKMTLYTFAKDGRDVSNCTGQCASKWPPVLVSANTRLPRGYSAIKRADGRLQLAYHHKPLYRWVKDHRPGEMTGDGVKGLWQVARP